MDEFVAESIEARHFFDSVRRERQIKGDGKGHDLIRWSNWDSNVMTKLLENCRLWINDGTSSSTASCAVFTQVFVSKKDEAFLKNPMRWIRSDEKMNDDDRTKKLSGIGIFRNNAGGPPSPPSVHGGAIATCFDTFLGQLNLLHRTPGMTANLTIKYKSRVPMAVPFTIVALDATVTSFVGRKILLEGTMRDLSTREVLATSTGLWIRRRTSLSKVSIPSSLTSPSFSNGVVGSRVVGTASNLPRTKAGAALLRRGWILDNIRATMPQGQHSTKYISDSNRLALDYLWNPRTRSFAVTCAFSTYCMGYVHRPRRSHSSRTSNSNAIRVAHSNRPPLLVRGCCVTTRIVDAHYHAPPSSFDRSYQVHGGCLFATLDQSITCMLYSRAATDFHADGGLALTTKMSVDYKCPTPLGEEYFVTVDIVSKHVDRRGRTRFTVEAKLFDIDLEEPDSRPTTGDCHVVGRAEFVQTRHVWPGQSLPVGSAEERGFSRL